MAEKLLTAGHYRRPAAQTSLLSIGTYSSEHKEHLGTYNLKKHGLRTKHPNSDPPRLKNATAGDELNPLTVERTNKSARLSPKLMWTTIAPSIPRNGA